MRDIGFNGPSRELSTLEDHLEESVYCVSCGTIFVRAGTGRSCPACANAAAIEELEQRLDDLEDDQEGSDD